MSTIAIIGAMDEEVANIASALSEITVTEEAGVSVTRGTIETNKGTRVNVAATVGGMGTVNIAATTQHLIDIRQERDSLLRMSDFGDMGEFLCTCSELFPEEETPEYRYTKWEEIPDPLINREWLCPNFFDIREAMEQLEEPDKDFFFDWCDRYGHDISTEDPHLLVAHYLELFGNVTYIDDDSCPDSGDDSLLYYPGISGNYFDNCFPRFEVFDDNYD